MTILQIYKSFLEVHAKKRLQSLIDYTVEERVFNLFKEERQKASTGTYTELYQTVKQASAKKIYLGGAEHIISTKVGKLAESHEFIQHVIHHLIQSPTITVTIPRLVKHDAEIAVGREARFRDQNVKEEPDIDGSAPSLSLTGDSRDSWRTSKNEKKKDIKKLTFHSLNNSSCKKCDSSKGSPDHYKVDHHDKGPRRGEVLKASTTYFTEVMQFKIYRRTLQSKKFQRLYFWKDR